MSEVTPKMVTREEFNRELVAALDDLVSNMKYHGDLIQKGIARSEERRRQRLSHAREIPPPYPSDGSAERFDRLDDALEVLAGHLANVTRDIANLQKDIAGLKDDVAGLKGDVSDIRERMATKVSLEATSEHVKQMADGYAATQQRLDRVADMLKTHVIVR